MKKITIKQYRQRLNLVVEYIYSHLDSPLDVNTLAEIACMSPYHFHRVFREMTGENINVTVRRLRLHFVASQLIRSSLPLDKVAQQSVYSSAESLNRAFRQHFGETPIEYRKRRQAVRTDIDKYFVAPLTFSQKEYSNMFDVEVNKNKALQLIGLDHLGDYLSVGESFQKVFMYAGEHGLLNDQTRSIGIYYDDPKTVEQDKLRSLACISVPEGYQLEKGSPLRQITIPAATTASLTFKGAYAELETPYDWFFGQWLPQSGEQAIDFPPFEEYLNDPKNTPSSELLTRINCLIK